MKTQLFFIFLLLASGIFLPHVFASSLGIIYPEPPRVLPEGAKMRIGRGQGTDFAFSQDGAQLAVACSIVGIWIYNVHTGNELMLLTGHTNSVTSVVYSPDGVTLASGSYDRTVRLWNAHTFEHRVTLTGHAGDTKALAFSPDGATLASGASRHSKSRGIDQHVEETEDPEEIDSSIRLWDVATGQHQMTLTGHTGWITALTFSPDGATLASASTDGTVRLWDAATGRHKMTLNGHTDQVVSVVCSSDGTRLTSWSYDETVRLWDVHTGEQKLVIEGNNYGAAAFSPDGLTLVSSQGSDNAIIRLWDAHSGEQKAVLDAQLGAIFSVVFSPDGSKLVSIGDRKDTAIRWWDANGTKFRTALKDDSLQIRSVQKPHPGKTAGRAGQIPSLVFSPDGATLAERIDDKIQLWDVHTRKQKAKIEYPDFSSRRIIPLYGMNASGWPYGRAFVAFSPDAGTLACGDGTVKIWLFDSNTGKYRATLNGHTDVVSAVAFSPDGTMLASASEDSTVRVWVTHTGEHRATLNGHTDAVYLLAFSPDGRILASYSRDRTVRLWDVQTGKERRMLTGNAEAVRAVAFTDDGNTLVSLSEEDIRIWDVPTRKQRSTFAEGLWRVSSMALSPDRGTLVSGSRWEIQFWNAYTGQHKGTLTGHLDNTVLLAFSPDGTMLASAGRTIQLWDVGTRKNRSTFIDNRDTEISHLNPGNIWSLAFSADSQILAAGVGSAIELWDVSLHQHRATLRGHGPPVTSIAFAPHGGMLASASYDGTVVLWEPVPVIDTNTIAKISPLPPVSPVVGGVLTFNIEIIGAESVAGYQLTVEFDGTALRYVSSANGDYLTDNAFFGPPTVEKNRVTVATTALTAVGSGSGVLATVTFEVVEAKPSLPRLKDLTDSSIVESQLLDHQFYCKNRAWGNAEP